jgi:aromatic amino acid transport protein AroP
MVYSSSRLLYGMAQEGNAPKSLAEVNKRGVPVKAIVYPGIVTAFCVVLNYVAPAGVIELLISLITAALVIIWTIIIISHLNYRKLHDAKGTQRSFKAPLFPLTNYICLAAMALVVVVMLLTPGVRASAYAIPVWVLAVYAMYRMVFRQPVRLVQTAV